MKKKTMKSNLVEIVGKNKFTEYQSSKSKGKDLQCLTSTGHSSRLIKYGSFLIVSAF